MTVGRHRAPQTDQHKPLDDLWNDIRNDPTWWVFHGSVVTATLTILSVILGGTP